MTARRSSFGIILRERGGRLRVMKSINHPVSPVKLFCGLAGIGNNESSLVFAHKGVVGKFRSWRKELCVAVWLRRGDREREREGWRRGTINRRQKHGSQAFNPLKLLFGEKLHVHNISFNLFYKYTYIIDPKVNPKWKCTIQYILLFSLLFSLLFPYKISYFWKFFLSNKLGLRNYFYYQCKRLCQLPSGLRLPDYHSVAVVKYMPGHKIISLIKFMLNNDDRIQSLFKRSQSATNGYVHYTCI